MHCGGRAAFRSTTVRSVSDDETPDRTPAVRASDADREATVTRLQAAQVDPDVAEDRAHALRWGGPDGQLDVAEDARDLLPRPLTDDLDRMRRAHRQVGDEQVQLGSGNRGEGGVGPLSELVEVDAPLPDRSLEARDGGLAIGIGGADGRGRIQFL